MQGVRGIWKWLSFSGPSRSLKELPTAVLMVLGSASFAIAGFYGILLAKVVPDFVAVGNRVTLTAWGWPGFSLLGVLAGLGALVWFHGNIAATCNGILRQRLFE